MPTLPFWEPPEAQLLADLSTGPGGLSAAAAAERLRRDGPNELAVRKKTTAGARILGKLKNPLVVILLFASVVSSVTGDVAGSLIIAVVVTASVMLDYVQEVRAERTAESLRSAVALRARVRRGGKEEEVPAHDLVVGDVVVLAAGNLVPADARVIEARDLFVNQAALTGEPYPVEKHRRDGLPAGTPAADAENVVLMGSSVVSGCGVVVLGRTGGRTELGAVATGLARAEPPTAFEQGLQSFGLLIARVTMLLVLTVLLLLALAHRPMLESLLFAVALAVGLTPELLPMVVTVTLARGAMRLAKRKVIVKRLRAVQDLGSLDVFCTDKTGTLTEARIRLEAAVDASGAPSAHVLELAWLNARFESGLQSPLDAAILAATEGPAGGWRKIDELPFDFERRRVSVLVEGPAGRILVVKGAPEEVLAHSGEVELGGQGVPLGPAEHAALKTRVDQFGEQGLRALGVAWRTVPADHDHCLIADETALRFAGLLAFLDPPKAGAMEAIHDLEEIGVDVKIVTGDSEAVTRHLCASVGFPLRDVMLGHELEHLDDSALAARAEGVDAFCRFNPSQKARVIHALRRRGHVVGYMGDGVNDAPSLHAADVGISVDDAVDVAREAATLLLTENRLDVLVEGVREGRRTFGNVMKYIEMGTSSNFGNMFSMAFAAAFLPFLPMRPVQILVNNLLYDVANLPIPLDDVDEEQLATVPRWDIAGVRRFMWMLGPVSSVFDLLTFGFLLLLGAGEREFQTGWFVESMATQTLVIFVIRTRRAPWKSRPAKALVAATFTIVAVAVALPFSPLAPALGFVALPPLYFFGLGVLVLAYLSSAEGMKRLYYRRKARA